MASRKPKADSAGLDALRVQLGGDLPDGLSALNGTAAEQLAELLGAARVRQQAHIEAALQAALSHLPALLRGPVRKLFDA